jgi:hypothetical protein
MLDQEKKMKILRLMLPLMLCLVGCSRSSEDLAVKQTFEGYKSSILNDDGDAAYKLVDKNTREWYETTLDRVLTWDQKQIMDLGVLDKMQVILIRHRIPKDELLQMTSEALFKYAVNHGWVGKNSVSGIEIGKIDIQGNFATGVVRSNGQDSPFRFHFYKENGSWRIDLTEMTKWGEAAFIRQIEESGASELDYILRITQVVSGKPVQESIWTPLK